MSKRNSSNRGGKQAQHITGNKSYSQVSHENGDLETEEEPSDIRLWHLTHCPKGEWKDEALKQTYEDIVAKIVDKEMNEGRTLSIVEQDEIFQDVIRTRPGYIRGRGYMAKPPTYRERLHAELDEQARRTAETIKKNEELVTQVQKLKRLLQAEREERAQMLEVERVQRERQIEVKHLEMERALEEAQMNMRGDFMDLLLSSDGQISELEFEVPPQAQHGSLLTEAEEFNQGRNSTSAVVNKNHLQALSFYLSWYYFESLIYYTRLTLDP